MSDRKGPDMDVELTGGVAVVALPQRIDTQNAPDVQAAFDSLLEDGARAVVADFQATEYISSAGLRVFLAVLKALQKDDGRMVLCGMKPFVADVFDIAGFTQLFTVVADREAAVAAAS